MNNQLVFRYQTFNVSGELTKDNILNIDPGKVGNLVGVDINRFRFSQVVESILYYHKNTVDTLETIVM